MLWRYDSIACGGRAIRNTEVTRIWSLQLFLSRVAVRLEKTLKSSIPLSFTHLNQISTRLLPYNYVLSWDQVLSADS